MRLLHIGVIGLVALLAAPAVASAKDSEETVLCKDGSTSKAGKGACSGHGGVDRKATKAGKESEGKESAAATSAAKPAAASAGEPEETVVCKDGTTSKGGRGACRGHGGVDKKATKGGKEPAGKESAGAAPAAKPAAASAGEAGEMVVCKDGTTSKGGRGACRGHGGVDKKAGAKGSAPAAGASAAAPPVATPPAPAPAAVPPAPAPAPAAPPAARPAAPAPAPQAQAAASDKANPKNTDPTGAIAKCKDGTYSHAKGHSGACSRHGGVAEWLDKPAEK